MEKIDFDKKYVDKLKIHYYSFDEMLAVAIKLEEMGYKLWKPVQNLTELTGNCYYYDGSEWLRTISKFDIRNIGRFHIRNGHRIRIEIEAEDFLKMDIKKFKKIENPDIDPYGEEDWGYEEVKENIILKYNNYIKESKSRTIDKFKLVNLNSLIPILGMNEFVKYMNEKVVGKMVQFYNRKDGRNIKKERICNGAYWLEDKRELFIIGNKKEYCVNIFRPFGYYVEYSPSKNLELDPYGEEDWG